MSAKNQLQEYFQKRAKEYLKGNDNRFDLIPTYLTTRQGGSSHQPLWGSIVSLPDGTQMEGKLCPTKSTAEASAAQRALDHLKLQLQMKIKRTIEPRTVLLVDLENMPTFINDVVNEIENIDIYAFVGVHHCLSSAPLPDGVVKIISPSTRADGTDTCIQVYVGWLLGQNRYDNYLIATRDHFGSALVDIISNSYWIGYPFTAKVVTDVNQI